MRDSNRVELHFAQSQLSFGKLLIRYVGSPFPFPTSLGGVPGYIGITAAKFHFAINNKNPTRRSVFYHWWAMRDSPCLFSLSAH